GALAGSVYLWDVASGRELNRSATRAAKLTYVAFSADGRLMATEGGTTNIWDLTAGAVTQSYKGGYNTLFFTPDNQSLVRGFLGVDRLSLATGRSDRLSGRGSAGLWQTDEAFALSPDGELVAGQGETGFDGAKFDGSGTGKIDLLSVRTNSRVKRLDGHLGVRCLAFSPDNKLLASGGLDGVIKLWDVTAGRVVRTLAGHKNWVDTLAFSPKGEWLASAGLDGDVKIWDVQSGAEVRTLETGAVIESVAFSPDGRTLAAGVWDNTIRLWDAATGAELFTLSGHTDKVRRVVFTPDGRILASIGYDDTIKLWRMSDNQLLATIIVTGNNDWLVVTPDGLFDGTPAAWGQIQWRFSPALFDVAPVEWFFNDFYYPGLLADICAGKNPRAKQNIAQKDRHQPQLTLALAAGQTASEASTSRTVKLTVGVGQAEAGAQDVRLFRNGSLVKVWRGDVLQGRASALLETDVALVAGANRFNAYAFNRDDIKSADATLVIKGADSLKRQATAYVFAVGVNIYANPEYKLSYAVADAQEFAAETKRQQEALGNYARVEVTTLFDADATKANIMQQLAQLAARVQPEDTVLIYFAGHGTAHGRQFYLIPHDLGYAGAPARLDAAGLQELLAHSISDRELEAAFAKLDAGQLLLVIDACNSGQALEAEERRRGPMNSQGLAQLAYEKGMYILTAAQSFQLANEAKDLGHGYLTFALIDEGLQKAAADAAPKDGAVTAREWFNYAVGRVPHIFAEERAKKSEDVLAKLRGMKLIMGLADVNDVQQPRVFYRRELETQTLVIARPAASAAHP